MILIGPGTWSSSFAIRCHIIFQETDTIPEHFVCDVLVKVEVDFAYRSCAPSLVGLLVYTSELLLCLLLP